MSGGPSVGRPSSGATKPNWDFFSPPSASSSGTFEIASPAPDAQFRTLTLISSDRANRSEIARYQGQGPWRGLLSVATLTIPLRCATISADSQRLYFIKGTLTRYSLPCTVAANSLQKKAINEVVRGVYKLQGRYTSFQKPPGRGVNTSREGTRTRGGSSR